MARQDRHYFKTRAIEEHQRSSEAPTAEIARIHKELAAKYEALGDVRRLPSIADREDDGIQGAPL